MSARSDVTYVYDGSFEGLLTAVFESFESRELPCSIVAEDECQAQIVNKMFGMIVYTLRSENLP